MTPVTMSSQKETFIVKHAGYGLFAFATPSGMMLSLEPSGNIVLVPQSQQNANSVFRVFTVSDFWLERKIILFLSLEALAITLFSHF